MDKQQTILELRLLINHFVQKKQEYICYSLDKCSLFMSTETNKYIVENFPKYIVKEWKGKEYHYYGYFGKPSKKNTQRRIDFLQSLIDKL